MKNADMLHSNYSLHVNTDVLYIYACNALKNTEKTDNKRVNTVFTLSEA